MDIFKKASRLGLRVLTAKGELSVEQLWTLSRASLAKALKVLNEEIKGQTTSSEELSFLDDNPSTVDEVLQLKFDVVKDIFLTKKQEALDAANKASIKEKKQKIMALIAEKQDEELKSKSSDELLKELEALG